ncbi:MAG: SelT/SelW/SelH family protein [Pseudomonadota bacterium]
MAGQVKIVYCTQCGWLLRSSWMAQELLTTFAEEIAELTLAPATGGVFEVYANDQIVWSRADQKRFPAITELKRAVRDVVAPEKSLGHVDKTD